MLFIILIPAVIMLHTKGANGQDILFDPLRLISPCSQGLRNGTDKFTFTGTIYNYTALLSSYWASLVILQMSVPPSQFAKLCDIFIGLTGTFCDPASNETCYCDHINTTTGSAHIVVKYPADKDFSEGIIRAQWANRNGQLAYSKNNITLPVIYDVNEAKLTLHVNSVPVKQTPSPFVVHFVSNKTNTLQLCCTNSASPCYPRLTVTGKTVESPTNNCVNYTVFAPNVSYTADVTLSYSVCTKSHYITAGSGVITAVEETTSTITSTSKAPVTTTTPRTTTLPFLGTTETRYDQADHENLLTKFWPGLIISGLGFVLVLVWVVWDAVSNETSKSKSFTAVNEGELIEKNEKSEGVQEEKENDTLKERDISSRMSETEV